MDVFSCEPGWEDVLAAELGRVFPPPRARIIDVGWVASEVDRERWPAEPVVAFAAQCMPEAVAIEAPSISKWVQAVGPQIIEALAEHRGPWRLHVFGVYRPEEGASRPRAQLIEQRLVEWLRQKQRRLVRSLTPEAGHFAGGEAIVQIGLIAPGSGYAAICLPETLRQLRHCISPSSGGTVEVPPDRAAPSRAFAKLIEAELRLGGRIEAGDTCVDWEAAPEAGLMSRWLGERRSLRSIAARCGPT